MAAPKTPASGKKARRSKNPDKTIPVSDYEHSAAKRTNNPPAGLAHLDRDETPTRKLAYNPHLDPQMQWAGKSERTETKIPAPSIHVHEELSAQKIVGSVRRQRLQQPLFDLASLDPTKAVEFYQHEMNWSNRMILGDSLVVMASLLERERMGGQVQCVFIDPPYGVKYNSNFQPRIGDTDVKDRKDDDMTREPEMIQAYRDTWELGVHSYLTYLRDRFAIARELLSDSGSIFVQISDENVHLVRVLLDEVFGYDNYVAQIVFTKTSGLSTSKSLPGRFDYLLWYGKNTSKTTVNSLYEKQSPTESGFNLVELIDGTRRPLTREEKNGTARIPDGARLFTYGDLTAMGPGSFYEVELNGRVYTPYRGWWGVPEQSMKALIDLGRVVQTENSLQYIRYFDDFPYKEVTNLWEGFGGAKNKRYVVQTNEDIVERCLQLSTAPGDLVVDPTCGSGTTAAVAEKLGRRWITVDTSRVAIAIARERLLTATFPYFVLKNAARGVDGGFEYATVERWRRSRIARGEGPEVVSLTTEPKVVKKTLRVAGPFTVESLSRYAVNPSDDAPSGVLAGEDASSHVQTILVALETQGIPRPSKKPAKISSLRPLAAAGALQAEGVADLDGKPAKFAVSLGPRFGSITMAQVSDALQQAIGYELVVFAGFAVSTDVQAQLSTGKVGTVPVALLLANPDLLVGNLLKNTKASQTFRLYASPDVKIISEDGLLRVEVEGVDSFDASTGEVISFGKSGIQAWFLDDCFDGKVFRVSQALFPVSNGWEKLSKALRGTVDADLVQELHSWKSLPFNPPETGKIAVRVIANDGNASEVIVPVAGRKAP